MSFCRRFAGMIPAVMVLATPAVAGQIHYKYDKLGRIIQVDYADGTVVEYQYDANGNRALVRVTGAPSGANAVNSASTTFIRSSEARNDLSPRSTATTSSQ